MIADTKHIKKQAWREVAQEQGLLEPSEDQLTLILDMRLERAITEVQFFCCTKTPCLMYRLIIAHRRI